MGANLPISERDSLVNRRRALRWLVGALLGIIAPIAEAMQKLGTLISEKKNPEAVRLHFAHDARRAKARQDSKAYCRNCTEYTRLGTIGADDVGRCNLLTGGVVRSRGWCSSWVMNPDEYKKES